MTYYTTRNFIQYYNMTYYTTKLPDQRQYFTSLLLCATFSSLYTACVV